MADKVHVNGGIGFWGLLTVALVVLKLTGHITLGWGTIVLIFFAPLWIALLTILGFALCLTIFDGRR